ncbi:hypothetical protein JL721_11317 [Aureococcus anophagefferens]|nr:hypothetical protein JL721_11317 [Aureococcus anophagefferens]
MPSAIELRVGSVDAAARAFALGYDTVCLDRRLAEDHQCASVAFAPHTIVDTADNAASVFAVDVDGDGDLDVLSASSSDDTVAWYDDDGAVSFTTRIVSRLVNYARPSATTRSTTPPTARSTATRRTSTATAPPTLAASRNDDTVAWYANDGALTFAKAVISATPDQAAAVFAIDVDGDGDVDALSASRNDNTVAWYENDGAQSFSKRIITFAAGYANAVVALDVDGDGDVDAVSAQRPCPPPRQNDGSQS